MFGYAIPFYLLVYDEISFNGVSNKSMKKVGTVGFRPLFTPKQPLAIFSLLNCDWDE